MMTTLTAEQLKLREGLLGGTVANVVMTDEEGDELLEQWKIACGIIEPPDFSNNWPVNRGAHMETFALDWHERKTRKKIVERGRVVRHPHSKYSFLGVTLDGYRPADAATVDYKDCGGFRKLSDILYSYTAQAVLQRMCRQATRCIILLSHGGGEPVEYPIEVDEAYEQELLARMSAFFLCVTTMTPPTPLPPVVPPEKWRRYELDRLTAENWPNWAGAMRPELKRWDESKDAADHHAAAGKTVRELLPADVGYVSCDGISVTRNRAGAVTIKRGTRDE